MGSEAPNTAALWKTWQRLYPLYCALAHEFVLEAPPCPDLDIGVGVPGPEAVREASLWFSAMDSRIQIHHLRHFAQTSPLMVEQAVSDMLFHALNANPESDGDRDKVDFLVVQLLAMRLPPRPTGSDISLTSAMKVFEALCGRAEGEPARFTKNLEKMIAEADSAKNLNALFTSRIIERSREIKHSCGADFFQPQSLGAFARFGYLIRRRFFQLMQQDLNAILDGLRELESRGVTTIDCRRAQFSAEEPIARIRMICNSWRVMFQAEYSSGQPLCLLVDLKTAVELALAQPSKPQASAAFHKMTATAASSVARGR
ncbi:MAG TPA: hypothetical protein VL156_04250 [Terriglobales bacterium]|jgi:hypothetical protein|nr:hypothetical protein [Terriglobales bacterium]